MWSAVRRASLVLSLALTSCGGGASSLEQRTEDLPSGTTATAVDDAGVPLFLKTAWYLSVDAHSAVVYDFSANADAPEHTVAVTRWWRTGDVWQADEAERFAYDADRSQAVIERAAEPERWSFVATTTTALHVSTSAAGAVVMFNCESGALPITVFMVTHGCSGF
jgi:hypothetical protein